MREIKFRAWVINPRNNLFCSPTLARNEMVNNILVLNKEQIEQYLPFERCDDVIFMQYTGLKDKHDKDIYEGDILRVYDCDNLPMNDELFEVIFLKGFFGCSWIKDREALIDYLNDYCRESEVIGNIYENGELLKEVKE